MTVNPIVLALNKISKMLTWSEVKVIAGGYSNFHGKKCEDW